MIFSRGFFWTHATPNLITQRAAGVGIPPKTTTAWFLSRLENAVSSDLPVHSGTSSYDLSGEVFLQEIWKS
jgi:hypothetical protein